MYYVGSLAYDLECMIPMHNIMEIGFCYVIVYLNYLDDLCLVILCMHLVNDFNLHDFD